MSLLQAILESKRREVNELRSRRRSWNDGRNAMRTPIDPVGALRRSPGQPLHLIAEVKLRSPSAGVLSQRLAPAERAIAYAEAGAAMVSVLCDTTYFGGAWRHLAAARKGLDDAAHSVPLLAKEFVIDEQQVFEARHHGADAVLLIARIVGRERLSSLARAARAEGIEPLVEVVNEEELEGALAASARIVGVNARDLDTLVMDRARAARILEAIPSDVIAVHLSGLRDPTAVAEVARSRADAALIGEALMREDDPRAALRAMVTACG